MTEPSFQSWRKPSAVMIILAAGSDPRILLIARPRTLTYHAGQIAYPGGSFDARHDRTLWDTARRETLEEVGIAIPAESLAGFLDPVHIAVSGFTLCPIVAVVAEAPAVTPNPSEVSGYEWVSLRDLRAVRRMAHFSTPESAYWLPEFGLTMGRLWGATARVTDQLLGVLDGGGRCTFDRCTKLTK